MLPNMDRCLKCNGSHIIKGRILGDDGATVFRPEGLRSFSLTLYGGTGLTKGAFACLDCGLVWGSTTPEKLRKFVQKHCDPRANNPAT